jgi:hypothetical protein
MEQLDFFIKFVRNIHPKMKKNYLKRLFYSVTLLGIVTFFLYHFNFFSCNNRLNYIQKYLYQRQRYDIVVSDNEVVIINSYRARNGATLFSIQKTDTQWKLVQELKLDKYVPVPISSVVVNNNWLVVDCDSRSNSVIIFRKNNKIWEYYNKIDGDTEWFGDSALKLDNDSLIIGDWATEEHGLVFVYDLKNQPPLLKQKICPPKGIIRDNRSGFGDYLVLQDNWLVINDSGAYFSNDDIIKYGIKPSDDPQTTIGGIPEPVSRPCILLYSKNSKSEWIFVQDIFFSLPHPPNEILRNKNGNIVNFINTFSPDAISLANKKLFLYDHDKYYVFGLTDSLNWKYEGFSNPPFVPFWTEQENPYRFLYHFESIVIDSNYSAHFGDNGNIDIYRTTDYADWKSCWTIPFYNPPAKDILKLESVAYKLEINQNILVAYYQWFLQEKQATPTNTGKFAIFEIDSQKGPTCVFQMKAFDNGNLKVSQ